LKRYQPQNAIPSYFVNLKVPYSGVRPFYTKYGDMMAPIYPDTALANAIRVVIMILFVVK
jgi:hypothetical protein